MFPVFQQLLHLLSALLEVVLIQDFLCLGDDLVLSVFRIDINITGLFRKLIHQLVELFTQFLIRKRFFLSPVLLPVLNSC